MSAVLSGHSSDHVDIGNPGPGGPQEPKTDLYTVYINIRTNENKSFKVV